MENVIPSKPLSNFDDEKASMKNAPMFRVKWDCMQSIYQVVQQLLLARSETVLLVGPTSMKWLFIESS